MTQSGNGWTEGRTRDLLTDPFYAVELAPIYGEPHQPIVDEDTWVGANVRGIEEEGSEAWLRRLLRVLKGDGEHHRLAGTKET